MWNRARLVVIWLLAVAMPWQGVSAAIMLACDADTHEAASAHSPEHAQVMAALAGSQHHRFHQTTDAHATPASSHADNVDLGHPCKGKRSVCASCCTAAAIRSEPVVFGTIGSTDFYRPLVSETPAAFLTPGIDRPPRIVFA